MADAQQLLPATSWLTRRSARGDPLLARPGCRARRWAKGSPPGTYSPAPACGGQANAPGVVLHTSPFTDPPAARASPATQRSTGRLAQTRSAEQRGHAPPEQARSTSSSKIGQAAGPDRQPLATQTRCIARATNTIKSSTSVNENTSRPAAGSWAWACSRLPVVCRSASTAPGSLNVTADQQPRRTRPPCGQRAEDRRGEQAGLASSRHERTRPGRWPAAWRPRSSGRSPIAMSVLDGLDHERQRRTPTPPPARKVNGRPPMLRARSAPLARRRAPSRSAGGSSAPSAAARWAAPPPRRPLRRAGTTGGQATTPSRSRRPAAARLGWQPDGSVSQGPTSRGIG